MEEKDPPIEAQNFLGGVRVIDFGDIRVARGLSRRPYTGCKHHNLVYDNKERRVWCKDCERDIEPFDAFLSLVENFHAAFGAFERMKQEAEKARAHNIHLIACKELERAWRGRTMAVGCPHCRAGLLPEDFKRGGISMCSAEIERQRRKVNKNTPQSRGGK